MCLQDDEAWEALADLGEDDDGFLPFARLGVGLRTVYVILILSGLPQRTGSGAAAATAAATASAADMGEEVLVSAIEMLRSVADRVVLPALARRATSGGSQGTRRPKIAPSPVFVP